MKAFLCSLAAVLLTSCSSTTETMIGASQGLSSLPERSMDAAMLGALAGAPVYHTKHFFLGGDHIVTTSSGSNYQHALTASFKDAAQAITTGVASLAYMKISLAKEVTERFLQGQITIRQKDAIMGAIAQAQTAGELQIALAQINAAAP